MKKQTGKNINRQEQSAGATLDKFKGALYGAGLTLPLAFLDNHLFGIVMNQVERVYELFWKNPSVNTLENSVLVLAGAVGVGLGCAFPNESKTVCKTSYRLAYESSKSLGNLILKYAPGTINKGKHLLKEMIYKPEYFKTNVEKEDYNSENHNEPDFSSLDY